MKKFAVIGCPVAHSLSPLMFNKAFKAQDIDAYYYRIEVKPEELKDFLNAQKNPGGFSGLSVTIPHKEAVIPLVDEITPEAQKIGAVNTIRLIDSKIYGCNVDWLGVVYALRNIRDINEKSVFIFGAGGASRSTIYALQNLGVNHITVWNRTREKAKILEKEFGVECFDHDLHSFSYADIFINTSSVGLKGVKAEFPFEIDFLNRFNCVFDVIYGETKLLKNASSMGISTIDGKEMLLGQAFEQFRLYTGEDAPKSIMIKALA